MILPNAKEAKHKAWLYRILSGIYGDQTLATSLYFKGGTCAAMRGLLDRYSVDIDFDYVAPQNEMDNVRKRMEEIFIKIGIEVKEKSQNIPQYFLRYPALPNERNTLKIDTTFPPPKSNSYESAVFGEINCIVTCQTIETMFANKLVALADRWEKNKSIAGRDVYDIHHFFIQGFRYNSDVIIERRKKAPADFFQELIEFIESQITQTIIDQDINALLPYEQFRKIRNILKQETLMFLRDEFKRIKGVAK